MFQQGVEGYHTYRIPTIVQSKDETTLLAFAEGRKSGFGDHGDIDLVLKRSVDGGATWGALQVIDSNGFSESGNPAPVVDFVTGNIILPFVRDRENPVLKTSNDNGATWSELVDLGSSAKLSAWDGYFFGPVHGIQLKRGTHAGRIVVSGNHTRKLVYAGSCAYSNLIALPDGQVGVLFERDQSKRISLARFPLAWLESQP